jgi:phosphatidylglycerophosphatase A
MSMPTPIPLRLLKNPVHLLSVGFGSGLSPFAPGTMGTLVAIPLYWLVSGVTPGTYLLIILFTALLGIYLCGATARALGVHDHGGIVWDEIVGYLITMTLAPPGWPWMLAGFLLFRFFDILKPWPIRQVDHQIGGGLGIMMDDIMAGIYAWLVLQLMVMWLNP